MSVMGTVRMVTATLQVGRLVLVVGMDPKGAVREVFDVLDAADAALQDESARQLFVRRLNSRLRRTARDLRDLVPELRREFANELGDRRRMQGRLGR